MASEVTPSGHTTIRWVLGVVLILGVAWRFQTAYQENQNHVRSTCEIDLTATKRELEVAQKAVQEDSRTREAEKTEAAKTANIKIQTQLESCISEKQAQKTLFEQQIVALQALPEKQASALAEQMKAWQDTCQQLVTRTEALGAAKNEECARAAESVVLICRGPPAPPVKIGLQAPTPTPTPKKGQDGH